MMAIVADRSTVLPESNAGAGAVCGIGGTCGVGAGGWGLLGAGGGEYDCGAGGAGSALGADGKAGAGLNEDPAIAAAGAGLPALLRRSRRNTTTPITMIAIRKNSTTSMPPTNQPAEIPDLSLPSVM